MCRKKFCNINIPSFIGNLWWVLLLGNHLKQFHGQENPCKTYMLFAGWEVRMVKNCDRGLENAVRGRRSRAAFSRPRSQFFTIRTDLSRQITFLFFSCSKLVLQPITNGLVYATLSLNRLARRLLTICKNIFARNEY